MIASKSFSLGFNAPVSKSVFQPKLPAQFFYTSVSRESNHRRSNCMDWWCVSSTSSSVRGNTFSFPDERQRRRLVDKKCGEGGEVKREQHLRGPDRCLDSLKCSPCALNPSHTSGHQRLRAREERGQSSPTSLCYHHPHHHPHSQTT